MNSGGIDGSGGGTRIEPAAIELEEFEGLEKEALNSRGKFVGKTVREFENKTAKYLGPTREKLQKAQDTEQKALHKRRITILENHTGGNIGKALDGASFSPKGDQLHTDTVKELEESIRQITSLTDGKEVGVRVDSKGELHLKEERAQLRKSGLANKKVVSKKKFSAQIQKDLTVFFTNATRTTHTPHGLNTLQTKIDTAKEQGQITKAQHKTLTKEIKSQYQQLLLSLQDKLTSIRESAENQYEAEIGKLKAVHELTVGLEHTSPALLKRNMKKLQTLASDAYVQSTKLVCAECLDPENKSMIVTRDRLERSKTEMQELLAPVIKRTSRNPAERFTEIRKGTDPSHRLMTRQLSLPAELREEMNLLEESVLEEVKSRNLTTTLLLNTERKIAGVDQQLDQLRDGASKHKAIRRVSFTYQRERRELRQERSKLKDQRRNYSRDIRVFNEVIQSKRANHEKRKLVLGKTLERFGSTMSAATDSGGVLKRQTTASPIDKQLHQLKTLEGVTSFDVAVVNSHFQSIATRMKDDKALQSMADCHLSLVRDAGYSCHKALLMVGQASNGSTIDAESLQKNLAQLRENPSKYVSFNPDGSTPPFLSKQTYLDLETGETSTELTSSAPSEETESVQEASSIINEPEYEYEEEGLDDICSVIKGNHNDMATSVEFDELSKYMEEVHTKAPTLENSLKELLHLFDDYLWEGAEFKTAYSGLQIGCSTLLEGSDEDKAITAVETHISNATTTKDSSNGLTS